jgi:hypothetical protein
VGCFFPLERVREGVTQQQIIGSTQQCKSLLTLPIETISPPAIFQIGISDRLGLMTNHDYDRPRELWRGRLRALGWIAYFMALIILLFLFWPMTF